MVWFSRSYGYRGDLMYFRPLLAGVAAALPGTVVPVDHSMDAERYPDVPLRPVLRSWWLRLPSRRQEEAPMAPLPSPVSLWRLWRTRPDVAVCIEFTTTSLLGMAVARLRRARVLLLIENDPRFRGAPSSGRALQVKSWAAGSAHVVLVSNAEGARYVIEDLGVPADRVRVSPYLTSAPPGGPAPAPPVDDVVRLLFLNSVSERKGILPLVRALAELGPAARPWRLDVVGGGPLVGDVRRAADDLGIASQVRLHGPVDYDDIWAHYAGCHVVVCPTTGDYRSLAGFEAVTSGRPALLSVHDGAAAELARSGAAVVVVDPLAEGELVAALRELLTSPGRVEELLTQAAVPPAGFAHEDVVDTVVAAVGETVRAPASTPVDR
ncbi:glycosyltransferase family 4 protein [Klenkia terrae]|uniref:glycosyltransferase family 4 protein n=1 Tax=Klenkia terrae TaxID=1052259 RepID=UPI001CD8924A|nr:glycosyltransferase family 4 protein [Klenkia terrae]